MSDYYERLCELRTEKGISQKEAARDLSVSQALLSHYERGIREFGLDFLNRAADYYGVTTDYLLGRSDSRSGLNSEYLEDRTEDGKFTAQTVYRAAIMTHERMNAGSSTAGEKTDLLYAAAVYSTLFAAAKGIYPEALVFAPREIRGNGTAPFDRQHPFGLPRKNDLCKTLRRPRTSLYRDRHKNR